MRLFLAAGHCRFAAPLPARRALPNCAFPFRLSMVCLALTLVASVTAVAGAPGAVPMGYTNAQIRLAAGGRLERGAGGPAPLEDETYVVQDEKYFAPVMAAARASLQGIADVEGISHRILSGGAPHLILFVEGAGDTAVHGHPVLQTVRALAGNFQLGMEYQSTSLDDGSLLFGFILFQPFPTLELCWETHPNESVASVDGAWLQPVADLADVGRIEMENDRATLVLRPEAVRRIDRLSETHGHRIYRLRGAGIADATHLGTYTWLSGLDRIPGVQTEFTCRQPRRDGQWKEGVSITYLHQRFGEHGEARQLVCRELGLAEDVGWTVAEARPHYNEPVFAWVVHAPGDGGAAAQAPWVRAAGEERRRWLELAKSTDGTGTSPIPRHWTVTKTSPTLLQTAAPADALGEQQERDFQAFLRRNTGRDLAIVVRGEVAALATADPIPSGNLVLREVSPAAREQLAALGRGESPGGPVGEPASGGAKPIETAPEPPRREERFQVRLMAEPQDREQIPVTHFSAPGKGPGVVVAVQEDVILDGRSVTGAELESKRDALYLRLTLTPEAQDALDGACFSNMGKQLAIVYDGRLLSAPTISDWDNVELAFKGLDEDWPEVAQGLAAYLSE